MMHEKPLVSIVTVTFNLIANDREKLFRKCLESVHSQTYENIEHIVIDGASSDRSVDLIREYADKGWVRYVSEPDKGIYDAFNKGIRLAKGKYVTFLNSDDYYHDEGGVEASVGALEKSDADFSYAPAIIKFEDETPFSAHPQFNPKITNVFFLMPFCHQTMFTKREVMVNENMFDTNYKSAADYDFVIRLCLKKYKCIFVEKSFVTYQFAGVSSIAQENSLKETSDIWRKRYGDFFPMDKNIIDIMRENIYTGNYYNNIPYALAEKFSQFKPYFDFNEYQAKNKRQKYLRLKNKLRFSKLYSKIRNIINI